MEAAWEELVGSIMLWEPSEHFRIENAVFALRLDPNEIFLFISRDKRNISNYIVILATLRVKVIRNLLYQSEQLIMFWPNDRKVVNKCLVSLVKICHYFTSTYSVDIIVKLADHLELLTKKLKKELVKIIS